jgi:hypothetical protein
MYTYYLELRGQKAALLRTLAPVRSPEELFRMVTGDALNFQRVYDLLAPQDVTEVILTGDTFDFLVCGDIEFFRDWLRSEILQKHYSVVARAFETPF